LIFDSMPYRLPKLYAITDVKLSGLSHAEQVAALAVGGATLIQLREKHLSADEFYREARDAVRVARTYQVKLLINDRVDVALAVGADGVHLGQDDLPPEAARRLLGEDALVGFSTHNLVQAREATRLPIDYLALGPVFQTTTKENPDPVVGPDRLREVRESVGRLPLVGIGGITIENARSVLAAGADSVAVVSWLLSPGYSITSKTKEILSAL
jgi:thiamine-phosphate pyrophosphorylase